MAGPKEPEDGMDLVPDTVYKLQGVLEAVMNVLGDGPNHTCIAFGDVKGFKMESASVWMFINGKLWGASFD